MGGHTQYGEYLTLDSLVKEYKEYKLRWEDKYNLWLKYVSIQYNSDTNRWTLAMRFTK